MGVSMRQEIRFGSSLEVARMGGIATIAAWHSNLSNHPAGFGSPPVGPSDSAIAELDTTWQVKAMTEQQGELQLAGLNALEKNHGTGGDCCSLWLEINLQILACLPSKQHSLTAGWTLPFANTGVRSLSVSTST